MGPVLAGPRGLDGADRRDRQVAVVVDPSVLRPTDPECIGTDPALARSELGWAPTAGLDAFLEDMLAV